MKAVRLRRQAVAMVLCPAQGAISPRVPELARANFIAGRMSEAQVDHSGAVGNESRAVCEWFQV